MAMNQNGAVTRVGPDLRLIPLTFLGAIVIGAVLLVLPVSLAPGKELPFLDSLFLATSATCVTGLSTINAAECLSGFGQTVLLVLIQVGGLGIITAGTLFLLIAGGRMSLAQEGNVQAAFGQLRARRPFEIIVRSVVTVLAVEGVGAVLLYVLFRRHAPLESGGAVAWEALFHSVSAFCNAGLSNVPEGLVRWRDDAWILAVFDLLVIAGGIGLLTLLNLYHWRPWRRDVRRRSPLTLQSKLALGMAAILLAAGTLLTLVLESNHTLAGQPWSRRIAWSFVHSVMTRTAGFNVVDVGDLHPATQQLSLVLMFVGGAPGSMAGGIKTVAAALLLLTAWTVLQRRPSVTIHQRTIPRDQVGAAVMLVVLSGLLLMVTIGLLMVSENGGRAALTRAHWLGIVFEAVSAFATVGLSTGVTPLLTAFGKVTIILLMFAGRVGPLVFATHIARPQLPEHVRYPEESVSIG